MKPETQNPTKPTVPFGSNEIRLSARQWVIAAAIVVLLLACLPVLWKMVEPFDPGPYYRVPHTLSNDYWVYSRLVEKTTRDNKILVVGDSVTWGEYVTPDQTLPHALNKQDRSTRFVNGGAAGTHPLALEGLVRYYAEGVTDTKVILHCNLLWMSSKERDLQAEKEMPFNHPHLVPQLTRHIPAYKASVSQRLGVVFDRHMPFRTLVNHLRVAYFGSLDLHTWSIEHPYDNPLGKIRFHLPAPGTDLRHRPISWTDRGIRRQGLSWVELDTSLQWRAFQKTVTLLQERRNRVFVIIGPFNEHMLTDDSLQRYGEMKRQAEHWVRSIEIPYDIPPLLPSNEYADASHPLSTGYARLARQIYENPTFQRWLGGRRTPPGRETMNDE